MDALRFSHYARCRGIWKMLLGISVSGKVSNGSFKRVVSPRKAGAGRDLEIHLNRDSNYQASNPGNRIYRN